MDNLHNGGAFLAPMAFSMGARMVGKKVLKDAAKGAVKKSSKIKDDLTNLTEEELLEKLDETIKTLNKISSMLKQQIK